MDAAIHAKKLKWHLRAERGVVLFSCLVKLLSAFCNEQSANRHLLFLPVHYQVKPL